MDNFMEQPTYKMNRGAILAQGCQRLVGVCTEDVADRNGLSLALTGPGTTTGSGDIRRNRRIQAHGMQARVVAVLGQ
ncbi:hypothetical protein FQ186_02710 [Pseudomonas sp. ANT_H14]|nr:hypothetical protein FQ182_05585 [Pseudomonas sp. ANT_H4]KAA0954096.1 hypothetical protein FQ186_02710 [Pseudomonas sp. ANT_H14]